MDLVVVDSTGERHYHTSVITSLQEVNVYKPEKFQMHLPRALKDAIRRAAKRQRTTISEYIRKATVEQLGRDGIKAP